MAKLHLYSTPPIKIIGFQLLLEKVASARQQGRSLMIKKKIIRKKSAGTILVVVEVEKSLKGAVKLEVPIVPKVI